MSALVLTTAAENQERSSEDTEKRGAWLGNLVEDHRLESGVHALAHWTEREEILLRIRSGAENEILSGTYADVLVGYIQGDVAEKGDRNRFPSIEGNRFHRTWSERLDDGGTANCGERHVAIERDADGFWEGVTNGETAKVQGEGGAYSTKTTV